MPRQGGRTAVITGTAILSALVVVFDYTLKYSGLKIPFPWMPTLKFDFTGIPILLSFLMYGLPSAFTTSLIALFAIVVRSGDVERIDESSIRVHYGSRIRHRCLVM